jgi:xylan 1,4-beta-xylosidase
LSESWIETPIGELLLLLLSLRNHRFLRVDPVSARIVADSPGPRPDGSGGARSVWKRAP